VARVDPRRHRDAVVNFRTTTAVKRYLNTMARETGENLSDFIRESVKLRIEMRRTYTDIGAALGYKDAETMLWHAIQEFSRRHSDVPLKMPNPPEQTKMEVQDASA
jgi:predicted kinase